MELTVEVIKTIEKMSYEQMLKKHRFAPSGDPMFEGDSGWLFSKNMEIKKMELSHDERVRISKKVGWE